MGDPPSLSIIACLLQFGSSSLNVEEGSVRELLLYCGMRKLWISNAIQLKAVDRDVWWLVKCKVQSLVIHWRYKIKIDLKYCMLRDLESVSILRIKDCAVLCVLHVTYTVCFFFLLLSDVMSFFLPFCPCINLIDFFILIYI